MCFSQSQSHKGFTLTIAILLSYLSGFNNFVKNIKQLIFTYLFQKHLDPSA